MQKSLKLALATMAFPLAAATLPATAVETSEPIKVILIDSSDADIMAYSFGTILERLGYNVDYVRIDYAAQIPALETGDVDVSTAIWDTTGWANLTDAVNSGNVVNYGSTGVNVVEGWWYPAYLTESCPGLPDWEALKDESCLQALSTIETEPRGRFIDAPADWETDAQKRMDALGLEIEAVNSGSPVTLIATLKSSVEKKEPVMGWGYIPHWFFESVEGGFVKLPEGPDACYDDPAFGPNPDATYDCGYTPGFVWKLGSSKLAEKAPEVSRYLHLFQMSTSDVSKATGRIENGGEDIKDVAAEWVDAHAEDWQNWAR